MDNFITWTVSDQPYAMDTTAVGSLVQDAEIAHVHFHHNQLDDSVNIWLNTGEGQWKNCSDRWATITADPVIHEVLSVPHRFLPDSGDSGGIRCILEEWKLAGGSANIAIPVVTRSGGIQAFWN